MTTTEQPMTSPQLAELRRYVSGWTATGRAVLLVAASLFVGAMLRSLVGRISPDAHFLWWLAPALAAALGIFWVGRIGSGGPGLRDRIRADLAAGVLRVHRIEVADAIEVQEQEDEGPSYFIQTTGGEVVVFSGQYLDNFRRRGFPWRVFEVTLAPASHLIFKLKRIEAPFPPSFVREPFTFEEFRTYGGAKWRLLDVEFESLKIKAVNKRT